MSHPWKIRDHFESNELCDFCKRNTNDELNFGKIYQSGEIVVHYFCLLFASHLLQKGRDHEGILGFLIADIRRELKRNANVECCYCEKSGAACSCGSKKCDKNFHFPCGRENNSFHNFYGQFRSFCSDHHPKSSVMLYSSHLEDLICVICQEQVENLPRLDIVYTSCCKSTCFHKVCIQKMALSAGYFFKCPNCNDQKNFRHAMLRNGIYIPDQDAAWELIPDSFNELYEQYNSCDASHCFCSYGRSYNSSAGCWRIIRCNTCGSQGIHKKCSKGLRSDEEWTCCSCSKIEASIIIKRNEKHLELDSNPSGCTSKQIAECKPNEGKIVKTTRNRFIYMKKKNYQSRKVGRITKAKTNAKRNQEKRVRCTVDGLPVYILRSCIGQLRQLKIVLTVIKE